MGGSLYGDMNFLELGMVLGFKLVITNGFKHCMEFWRTNKHLGRGAWCVDGSGLDAT